MAGRRDLDATGIRSYQIPSDGLTVRSPITDGLGTTIGRTVNVHLDTEAIASLVAVIAEINPDLILRVAAAITRADTIADSETNPSRAAQYARRRPRQNGGLLPYTRVRLLTTAAHNTPTGEDTTTP